MLSVYWEQEEKQVWRLQRGFVHTGFIKDKLVYKEPGSKMVLAKLVVIAWKFQAAVEELFLDEL